MTAPAPAPVSAPAPAAVPAERPEPAATGDRSSRHRGPGLLPTAALLLGTAYFLFPVAWVLVAATKDRSDLFSMFTLAPGGDLMSNVRDLSSYRSGLYWWWMANTVLYAGVGGLLSTGLSALSGYTLAKYAFPGRSAVFNTLLAGVLVPGVVLAVPQYLLLARIGMAGTVWSVLLPSIVSPYGIYLARIYAAAAVPDDVVEAARADGAGEFRIFRAVALPMMRPGLVTVFLFQFVAIWNNFMLPYIMLSDDRTFPLTVGLYSLLAQGADRPAMYSQVITGALLSIVPLVALFLSLQRYWRVDLLSGAVQG